MTATPLPFAARRSCGALSENLESLGAASTELNAAMLAGSIASIEAHCEQISDMASRARFLAATLERQIARHRQKNNPVVDQSELAHSRQLRPASPSLRACAPNSGFNSRDGGQS